MSIFNELYGVYFRITGKLLMQKHLTDKQIRQMIGEEGFLESGMFLDKKLLPQKDGSDWGFFRRKADGTLESVLRYKPVQLLTDLQKRWLRVCLDDPRMALFLTKENRSALRERLSEVPPLYNAAQLRYTDQFSDGDPYTDEAYQQHFRLIMAAIRKQEILHILYHSGHGRRMHLYCVPLKLEYSEKNDKFRLYCMAMRRYRSAGGMTLNLGRIRSVEGTGEIYDKTISEEAYFNKLRCKKPVTVRIRSERNSIERFLMEFAPYEKRTERDMETDCCTVQLWYDRQDETELLIRLLSFGPMLEILGPSDFRQKAAERIRQQYRISVES